MKKNKNEAPTSLLSVVEPFMEFELSKLRLEMINTMLLEQHKSNIKEQIGELEPSEAINVMCEMMAEMKVEMHYLKTAYIESNRYKEPKFDLYIPSLSEKELMNHMLIDLRTEIVGGNWWHPESDGRWAGPENESSIQIPAMEAGIYDMSIIVVDEIEHGMVDDVKISVNKNTIEMIKESEEFPIILEGKFEVNEEYKFPFWSIKLEFPRLVSPAKKGSKDDRLLSLRIQSIEITKVS